MYIVGSYISRRYDKRNGVDTSGSIPLTFLHALGPNANDGHDYVPTSPKSFDWMMRALPQCLNGFVFIDIGAGKGKTLLLASKFGFDRIIGVEFAAELVSAARNNILSMRRTKDGAPASIEVVEADATQYLIPVQDLVIYLFNPFSERVLSEVLSNIEKSILCHPRRCFIIYASSISDTMTWARLIILKSGTFREVVTRPMPFFLDAVRTVHYAVFEAQAPLSPG
jgi:hypothetical protein